MPLVSLIVTFVVGLIVFLPFPSWQQLVGFITSATVLSFGSGPIVLAAMRRQIPDHERPFRLPVGDVIPFLAFYSSNLIVYWAGWDVNWKLFVTIALGFVLLAVFHADRQGRHAASWTGRPARPGCCRGSPGWPDQLPGRLPGQEDRRRGGQHAHIGFGWGFVVLLALTAVVYGSR